MPKHGLLVATSPGLGRQWYVVREGARTKTLDLVKTFCIIMCLKVNHGIIEYKRVFNASFLFPSFFDKMQKSSASLQEVTEVVQSFISTEAQESAFDTSSG